MDLSPGAHLSHYRINGRIGAGGMGEVYRALDTRLNREVAIKVLPEALARDQERLARFTREAQLLASLNHPNIGAIYGLEEADGVPFLALELVEGEELAGRLEAGPMDPGEAMETALQIAAALEEAHGKGIIHRDLKPANVKLAPGGKVKVLDFGLAKSMEIHSAGSGVSSLETVAPARTVAGTILGSPGYMSPEQARGKPLDHRSDLWSFGCVLYQCLTGVPPFTGETVTDVLAAILEREPDWNRLPRGLPGSLRALLHRCLAKDASDRPAGASEAVAILREARDGGSAGSGKRSSANRWAVPALLAAGAVAAVALFWPRGAQAPAGPAPAPAAQLVQITSSVGVEAFPAWSPDGSRLAYSMESGGIRRIVVRDLASGHEERVTDGSHDEIQPAWSPDGRSLLFVRGREPGLKLQPTDIFAPYVDADIWRLDLAGGGEEIFVENAFHPSPSPDGSRVAVDADWVGSRRIWLVDRNGHNPEQLTSAESELEEHYLPAWSPDGSMIAYQQLERTKFDVRVVEVATRRIGVITDDPDRDLYPAWSPSGRELYFSSQRSGGLNIWKVPVGPGGTPSGPMRQVTTGAGQDVQVAISPDGSSMAFTILNQNSDLWKLPVSPETGLATGEPEEVVASTREDSRGRWSPDGRLIAFNSDRAGHMNIWIHDPATGETRQVTHGHGGDYQPVWSPDASRLVFFSNREGSSDIWEVILATGELRRLTARDSQEINPFYSPDGSLIAYDSDADGRMEVWVMGAGGEGQRRVTSQGVLGGHSLVWSPDGASIYFRCICGGLNQSVLAPLDGGEPVPQPWITGGSHLSFSPTHRQAIDVVGHKVLWTSSPGGPEPSPSFEFDDPSARIDYPCWSPDGRWVLFDRFRPEGGDIWMMKGLD